MKNSINSSGLGRFIAYYGTANAGAFVAFVPLLTLILPLKAAHIDSKNKLLLLSVALFSGAIMASIANILAGWASDKLYAKTSNRIVQIPSSLTAILISYYLFWQAESWVSLIGAILLFQFSFNFLFSPLGALLADHIPNSAKGRAAAILNLGLPIGTLSVAVLAFFSFDTEASRLLMIAIIVSLSMIPLLVIAPKWSASKPGVTDQGQEHRDANQYQTDLLWAWIARFSVQFSGAVMFGYIVYYLQDVLGYVDQFPTENVDQGVGKLSLVATPFAILAGIFAGTLSDRIGLRRPFMILSAALIAGATFSMAMWPTWAVAFPAYVLLTASLTSYLTIDAALVAQILASSSARAKILGYMNLTNTIPAILTPGLAILMSSTGLKNEILLPLILVAAALALFGSFAASRINAVS